MLWRGRATPNIHICKEFVTLNSDAKTSDSVLLYDMNSRAVLHCQDSLRFIWPYGDPWPPMMTSSLWAFLILFSIGSLYSPSHSCPSPSTWLSMIRSAICVHYENCKISYNRPANEQLILNTGLLQPDRISLPVGPRGMFFSLLSSTIHE